ncbi:PQ loop repeat protein [Aulographum hederae CBS 113979]|uniref:PQ loop repeat protein n=1 Tax=Aulographum hederae CBS 113979 TaxID=1176131 RepID=A0A6G1GWE5_9PEZI|nr:PQ loop repeat protein [Aulographum hederae CBS 113979]
MDMLASDPNGNCAYLASPSVPNFSLSILIVLGILVSYMPQIARIISRKSSEGLDPYFILLGTVSGTSAFLNICLLSTSREAVFCCKINSKFSCIAGILGIAQVGIQWFCFSFIALLFVIFFPRSANTTTTSPTILYDPSHPQTPDFRSALLVSCASCFHFLLTILLSAAIFFFHRTLLQPWAIFLGLCAAVLAMLQYLPQIRTTWRLRDVKSLSIPMMCIQTPGSAVFAGSLIARLGAEGWSSWGVYLVTGCLQGVLLGMGIYFTIQQKKAKTANGTTTPVRAEAGMDVDEDRITERTPLVGQNSGQNTPKANGNGLRAM